MNMNQQNFLQKINEKSNNINEFTNNNFLIEKLQNDIINLKKESKQFETRANILEGENNVLQKLMYDKEQLIAKYQKYYLDAKTRMVLLLEENKKLIKDNKKLKDKLEIINKEKDIDKNTYKNEIELNKKEFNNELDKIKHFYTTQLLEKNHIISELEIIKRNLENKLIHSSSYNKQIRETINKKNIKSEKNIENNEFNKLSNQNQLSHSQNIINYNNRIPYSANKRNNTKHNKINLTNRFTSYSELKTNSKNYNLKNIDSYYKSKLFKNNIKNENNNHSNNYSRNNKFNDFINEIKQKHLSPENIDNKNKVLEKFDNFLLEFE